MHSKNLQLNEELIEEMKLILLFPLDSLASGLKIHHDAPVTTRHAAIRLFDKGFITLEDGGYLTELGRELAEHTHNAVTLLTSERCL